MATDQEQEKPVKQESETAEPDGADIGKKIIKQVEYYFGDSNLPKDRFLQEKIKEDDGWVTLETMIKFNRLKQLTENLSEIAEALRESVSGLLEVNEEGTKVRRNPSKPMPENTEERRKEVAARTVYTKGFPLDTTLDTVQEFLEPYGTVDFVLMRKDENKEFKGSIFATFAKLEDAKKYVQEKSVTFSEIELVRKFKNDYFNDKAEEKKKLQKGKDEKKEKATARQQNDQQKKFENEITKGAMLYMSGFGPETRREDIKNLLQDYGQIAWVDFNKGDKEAWIRYSQENKAKEVLEEALEDMNNEITLQGHALEGRVLDGEEELERWRIMFEDIRGRRDGKNRRRDKPRWGTRPCKNKRNAMKEAKRKLEEGEKAGNAQSDEPQTKVAKVEEPQAKSSEVKTE